MKSLAILIYLHRIVNHIDRHTALLVNEQGLTLSQFAVLEALYHKGDLSIGSIKEAVLSSDGTIPVVIGNLQKQGLVVKETDPKDRRRSIVSLTSKAGTSLKRYILKMKCSLIKHLRVGMSEKSASLSNSCKSTNGHDLRDHEGGYDTWKDILYTA